MGNVYPKCKENQTFGWIYVSLEINRTISQYARNCFKGDTHVTVFRIVKTVQAND